MEEYERIAAGIDGGTLLTGPPDRRGEINRTDRVDRVG